MKNIKSLITKHWVITCIVILMLATLISFLLYRILPGDEKNIMLIYMLALVIIARLSNGYLLGIIASFISIICINFFFTYPHFKLNFILDGYPLTFIIMLIITMFTSALASHMKFQSELLAEHEKKLMEADKEKMRANLLRAVSHDLRTPLTSIIGSVSTLIENKNLTKQEIDNAQRNIYDDSNWLLNMVENLLSITRIENTTTKVKKSPEAVEEVVSEAVIRFKKRMPNNVVNINVPDELLLIPMDAMLIEQVIINLLENAAIHSNCNKPIDLKVTADDTYCTFYVKDYGVGINNEILHDIFNGVNNDRLYPSDSQRGMGIGLSICKTIILAHDGFISADNHENGAIFSFKLPIK